jgi:hypothetical protein
VQKGVEEAINRVWSDRPTSAFCWYYFIDEIDASAGENLADQDYPPARGGLLPDRAGEK